MATNILYVENNHRHFLALEKDVVLYNQQKPGEQIILHRAEDPDIMKGMLNPNINFILADVYFNNPETQDEDSVNRLGDIITYVKEWCKKINKSIAVPIIAYSGLATLDVCMENAGDLYDIWDKNSTSTKYVVWRLSNIVADMHRYKPESFLKMTIQEMIPTTHWHDEVKKMTEAYDTALSEYDQICQAEASIIKISNHFDTEECCTQMWDIMKKSETVSKALSRSERGHARHAMNVFWMGYCIINSPLLVPFLKEFWNDLLSNRKNMKDVRDDNYIEAFNNIWFYSALFHDIGLNVEKYKVQYEYQNLLKKCFPQYTPPLPDLSGIKFEIPVEARSLIEEIDIADEDINLSTYFLEGIKKQKPDHGLISATYFLQKLPLNKKQAIFSHEAARAAILHNIYCEDLFQGKKLISWKNDFISCLLLLCDQLQTWDRERDDISLLEEERIDLAELTNLNIYNRDTIGLKIEIYINYIPPSHISRNPDLFKKLKGKLLDIILKKPNKALKRIEKPWPFTIALDLSLAGKNFFTFEYI